MQHTDVVDLPAVEVALYLIGDFQPDRVAAAFDVVAKVVVAKGRSVAVKVRAKYWAFIRRPRGVSLVDMSFVRTTSPIT